MRLKDVDIYDIYNKWAMDTNHFRPFFRATNFAALKHYPDFELLDISNTEDRFIRKLFETIDNYDISTTLFIVEMQGTLSIKAAYFLHVKRNIKPILTFNSPLHEYGLIGDKRYISSLIGYGSAINSMPPNGYAFIVDSDRYGDYSDDDYKKRFNNQYELTDEDLPYYEMLTELGYSKIVYIGDANKEDLNYYFDYLLKQGMDVIKENLGEAI